MLAHHYAEAVRPEDVDVAWPDGGPDFDRVREKAVQWLRRAAEVAISRYEIDDGIVLFERAAALEHDRRESARIWREIGRAHALEYDSEAFVKAMERSLELTDEPQESAETYANLAFQASGRSGMWRTRVVPELVQEWSSLAIADAEVGGPTYVRALIARAMWGLDENAGPEARALADRLGDPELRSFAWDALGISAFNRGDYETAHTWEMRRFDLLGEVTDPDHIHDMHISAIPTTVAIGRIPEARRLALENDQLVARLTPHHRVHGIACVIEVEELAGNWERIRELEPRIELTVAQNLATPCVRNARSLLVCAAAAEILGDRDRGRALEAEADDLAVTRRGVALGGPRMRLALARADMGALRSLLDESDWHSRQTWFVLPGAAVRLDALAVIGSDLTIGSEDMQARSGYLEPFMLRALGIVRGDDGLLTQADERFRALGLDWHADQTEALIRFRNSAAAAPG